MVFVHADNTSLWPRVLVNFRLAPPTKMVPWSVHEFMELSSSEFQMPSVLSFLPPSTPTVLVCFLFMTNVSPPLSDFIYASTWSNFVKSHSYIMVGVVCNSFAPPCLSLIWFALPKFQCITELWSRCRARCLSFKIPSLQDLGIFLLPFDHDFEDIYSICSSDLSCICDSPLQPAIQRVHLGI